MERLPFKEIWAVDFEFHDNGRPGNRQVPVCMVAKELRTGTLRRVWRDELLSMHTAPFDTSKDSLIIAYYASAEIHCFYVLGWPVPENLIDCFAEFRVLTNGAPTIRGNGLLGALTWFGLNAISSEEKTEMRDLILSGGPWSTQQQKAILDYCQTDVDALTGLLPALVRELRHRPHWLAHALNRGNYMMASGFMEYNGVPVDTETLDKMIGNWDGIRSKIVKEVTQEFPVFDGVTFKMDLFRRYLIA